MFRDQHHFGEPLIALENIDKKNELLLERLFKNNDKINSGKMIIDKYTKIISKKRNKSPSMYLNKEIERI